MTDSSDFQQSKKTSDLPPEVVHSLLNSGLPKGYVHRSAKSTPFGLTLIDWLEHGGELELRGGKGITLAMAGLEGMENFYLCARTLHIIRFNAQIVTLSRLVSSLSSGDALSEKIEEAQVLCVPRFYDHWDSALTSWQRLLVEDLITTRHANKLSHVFHVNKIDKGKDVRINRDTQWWGEILWEIMYDVNMVFQP